MSNFQPLEVVGRGSEPQFQVGENLNKFTQQDKGEDTSSDDAGLYYTLFRRQKATDAYDGVHNCYKSMSTGI